jgi:tetrahydromethanopterin S-methyltransferase subunit B
VTSSTQEEAATDVDEAPRLRVRLQILLPVIFGAIHLVGLTSMILNGVNGDQALGLLIWEWPVFLLCMHPLFVQFQCSWTPGGWVTFAVAGTLIYALFGLIIGTAIDRIRVFIARRWRRRSRLPVRLQVRLPLILGGINLLVAVGGILTGGLNGEGVIGLILWDWPVALLCKYTGIGRNLGSYTPGDWGIFLLVGALIYALFGLVIGTAIDRIRAVIARRRG